MKNALISLSLSAALLGSACQNAGGVGIGPDPLALDTVASPSVVPGSAASPAGHAAVPFRADYVIVADILVPGDPGYPARCPAGPSNASGIAEGTGSATHLGKVIATDSSCFDFATFQFTLGEFGFTAPNGDQLWGEYEGSASMDPPPPNAVFECTFTLTGGTGRFEGASGEGVCVDSGQLGDGSSHIGFEGWIAYDASNRRSN